MSSALTPLLSLALPLLRRSMASCISFLLTCSRLQLFCFPRYISLLRLLCSFSLPFHHRRRTAFCRIHQRHWQFLFVIVTTSSFALFTFGMRILLFAVLMLAMFFVPFISSAILAFFWSFLPFFVSDAFLPSCSLPECDPCLFLLFFIL